MSIYLMQLNDELLSLILYYLPLKDKLKLKSVSRRFYRLLTKLILNQESLHLKQINLCEWRNAKFNEFNTLNLSNLNQINKLLARFSRIEILKLKLNFSGQLDYKQILNSSSTKCLKEFYLLTDCDTIYRQIIYLQIYNIESLTIYCNRYDHLQFLSKLLSFLNYFKKLQYFSSNLKYCNHQLSDCLNGSSNGLKNGLKNGFNKSNAVQLRNHTITNLHLSSFAIDSSPHFDLIRSFTMLKKLTILSVKNEYLDKFAYNQAMLTHLIINHLNTQFVNLDRLFAVLIKLKQLAYCSLKIHQLNKFDLKFRLLLTDFLLNSHAKLLINSFEIDNLNEFQCFLNVLPNRLKQTFNLRCLTGEDIDTLNYYSNVAFNRLIYSQVRSLMINKKFIRLKSIEFNFLSNLHHLEIRDYFGNLDELLIAFASNLNKLKTIKLIKINILNANTYCHLTKWSSLIHLEIQLKTFNLSNSNQSNLYNNFYNDNVYLCNGAFNKSIQTKQIDEDKQLIDNLYSLTKLRRLQKLILNKFKLTTNLLLFLLANCPNLYLLNVENCENVDYVLLRRAIKNKFALSSILK